jgi:restriction system protein
MSKVWLTRGGADGEYEDFALGEGTTGGGWNGVHDLSAANTFEEVRAVLLAAYPGKSARAVGNWSGQLWALRVAMEPGDYVLMPRKGQPILAIGVVAGPYVYDSARPPGERHYRKVDWKKVDVAKTSLGADIQRSLGTFMTICEINRDDIVERVTSVADSGVDPMLDSQPEQAPGELPNEDAVPPNVINDAAISIQELIRTRFPTHDLAALVEAVLRAEGYTTRLSPPGADGGVDILAARGDMGFEGPRIAVQVKNSISSMGVPQLNELVGAKSAFGADQALYVSWGGFTSEARRLARNEWFQLRLWDAEDLVREVTNVYNQLEASFQTRLPLRQVWVSAIESNNEDV